MQIDRQSRSSKYCSDDVQVGEKEGLFTVWKTDGSLHVANFKGDLVQQMPSCSCKDWIKWNISCNTSLLCLDTTQHGTENRCLKRKNIAPIYLLIDIKSTKYTF